MPTLEETLQQFQDAPIAPTPQSTLEAALAALRASGAHYGTDLMAPGQDPAAYDLANPPSPPEPARIAGLAGGPLNEDMPRDAVLPRTGPDFRVPVDRIGAAHDTASAPTADLTSDTEGYVPPPSRESQPADIPDSVGEADRAYATAASDVARAQSAAAQAKLAAETDHAQRLVQASEDSAEEQQILNHQFQRAREANEAKADADTAAWVQQMEAKAKEEPLPGRWWHNESNLGKALWGLGLLFSSAYAAITPGARNATLDMVRQSIQNDMEEQRARQGREMAILKLKGENVRQKQERAAADLRDDHSMQMTRLQSLERAWTARASVPGDLDAQAAKAASEQFFQEAKAKVIGDFRQERISATENQLNRRHAEAMQAASQNFQARQAQLARDFQAGENAKERQLRLDLAPVSISTGPGLGGVPLDKEGRPLYRQPESGISSPSGLIMLGPDKKPLGGTGAFNVRDDAQLKEVNDTVEAANTKYSLMQQLADKLDAGAVKGVGGVFLGVQDPEVESLMKQIGYGNAKMYDKRVTDADYNNGVAIGVGFNPDGTTLDKLKFQKNYDEVRKLVHKQLRDMPDYVSGQIHYDQTLVPQGSKAVWDPQRRTAPEVREQNAAEVEGVQPGVSKPVLTAEDYETAARTERKDPSQRGFLLPPHDSRVVEDLIQGSLNRAPSTIHSIASKLLDDLKAREQVQRSKLGTPGDPWDTGETDPATRATAQRVLDSLGATEGLVRNIEADLATKQQAQLDKFRKQAEAMWRSGNPSEADLRALAHDTYDLNDAEGAVRQIIADVRKLPKLPRSPFGLNR